MLAHSWDNPSMHPLHFPVFVQPKLNGIRAMWNGHELVSRTGMIWPRAVLPHIYDKLRSTHGTLDGELYKHGMPFQEICARCAAHRDTAHEDAASIEYVVYDCMNHPAQIYKDRLVAMDLPNLTVIQTSQVFNYLELDRCHSANLAAHYEGSMIRDPLAAYIPGRTNALLKRKPWKRAVVTIRAVLEGKGKFRGAAGALVVSQQNDAIFKVGSGSITAQQREDIWKNQKTYLGKPMIILYQEESTAGIPLQGRIFQMP